jgi:hypothetical protein
MTVEEKADQAELQRLRKQVSAVTATKQRTSNPHKANPKRA